MRTRITENKKLAQGTYRMAFEGRLAQFQAGQFLNLRVPGYYLRRPFAIAEHANDEFSIYYKVVGRGTEQMTQLPVGMEVELLAPLGNGFSSDLGQRPVLIGGGAGVGPIYAQAQALRQLGLDVTVVLGFQSAQYVYLAEEFEALGCTLYVTTDDGSYGIQGLVTAAFPKLDCDCFYACGPTPMLKAACTELNLPGEVSLEERMACGFGACVGCAVKTADGMQRVCKDGPVFRKEAMVW